MARNGWASRLSLGLCAATLALAGCAASGPSVPKVTARSGDVGLCDVVPPATFARVAGVGATEVRSGTSDDALTGLREVYCIYVDGSVTGQITGRGTINYEVARDARTAGTIFQMVRRSFVDARDVGGVGDGAFSGTPAGASGGTGLIVMRGSLMLYLSVGGDRQTVERVTEQLAALVLSRVGS